MSDKKTMKIAMAQMAPVFLNKAATIQKIIDFVDQAALAECDLIVFGEALLPGYPFWLSYTQGSKFNDQMQKEIHAHYMDQAVCIEDGDLDTIRRKAKEKQIALYLGIIERPKDRGGHSLYCSLVYIDKAGEIKSVHRKLRPTYEERLAWSAGDGHGLKVHPLEAFHVSGLNCWENWMPLSRAALYGQGTNVHIAVWPGERRNTIDITRFIAMESRSYVISVSGLLRKSDISDSIPHHDKILSAMPNEMVANGGSCIAGPDGNWIQEPIIDQEGIFMETISIDRIYQERQNFDPAGHYSRPDVTKLMVNTKRQSLIELSKGDINEQ